MNLFVQTADGSHLANVTDEEMQEHYDNFFEDVFVECEDKYGQVGPTFPHFRSHYFGIWIRFGPFR